MDGVFIRPERAGGFGVYLHREGSQLPMDWYRHKNKALAYALRVSADLRPADLPVFVEVEQ